MHFYSAKEVFPALSVSSRSLTLADYHLLYQSPFHNPPPSPLLPLSLLFLIKNSSTLVLLWPRSHFALPNDPRHPPGGFDSSLSCLSPSSSPSLAGRVKNDARCCCWGEIADLAVPVTSPGYSKLFSCGTQTGFKYTHMNLHV